MCTAVLQVKETEGGVKYVDVVKGEGANPSVSGSKPADSRGLLTGSLCQETADVACMCLGSVEYSQANQALHGRAQCSGCDSGRCLCLLEPIGVLTSCVGWRVRTATSW